MAYQYPVLLPIPFECFDYFSSQELPVGTVIKVPFGKQEKIGVVWDKKPSLLALDKIKNISTVLPFMLPKQTIKFVDWVAKYTYSPAGSVLKMALISDMEKTGRLDEYFEPPVLSHSVVSFSPQQHQAVQHLIQEYQNGFSVVLLDGVTGSGKTEVYFEVVAHALSNKKQVLILLPEIGLTDAIVARFQKRFGVKPAVWHSDLTPAQKRRTWKAVLSGQASVVLGARSALFLPFSDLGLIIVDEEHDSSYKQEDGVLYQARDMAVVRGQIAKALVVLVSATPSVETVYNVLQGKYKKIQLPQRFFDVKLPSVVLSDMRGVQLQKNHFLGKDIIDCLEKNLQKKEQSLLFLNRRGFAPVLLCRECGEKVTCPHCSVALAYHQKRNKLICHQCGFSQNIPAKCPTCKKETGLLPYGCGVERVFAEVKELFPFARVALVSSDNMTESKFLNLVMQINNNEIDILVGTQILSKGHHFPNLTFVGIIDADMGLVGGDLRATERTFQILHQVVGRAGRQEKEGCAILQTYSPNNLIMQALKENDRKKFLMAELQTRQLLKMPPFGKLATLLITAKQEKNAATVANALIRCAPMQNGVQIMGPVPAPLAKLKDKYRYRILVQAEATTNLQLFLRKWLDRQSIPAYVSLRVDINPYNFL